MRTSATLAAIAALLLAAPVLAQDCDCDYDDHGPRRPTGGYAGGSAVFAQPKGEFSRFVDNGWGGDLHYIHQIAGPLAVRLDGGILNYGYERQRVLISPTIGGRVTADLVTTNNVAYVGVGPQIGVPDGALRPYVGGFVGVSYLFTSSSVQGSESSEPFASSTNFEDAALAYGGGAGVYVPLRRGVSPVSLDLGVTYRNTGRAEYLTEGSITDHPDGSITLRPVRSETDLVAFHIGVSVGVTRRR